MPNWRTHLVIAKKVSKLLKYSDEDLEMFTTGNILPDINNGYIIKNISKHLNHNFTHYQNNEKESWQNFYGLYYNQIKNPLILGYYTHLLTDYFFNKHFYESIKNNPKFKKVKPTKLIFLKQKDFAYFNMLHKIKYVNRIDIDRISSESGKISNISITSDDILETIAAFRHFETIDWNPIFYTEDSFDELICDAVKAILKQYEYIKVIDN